MKKIFLLSLAALSVVSLTSCSLIYRPVKNEGTQLDAQQVNQMQKGLNKEQVLYILGTPNVYKTQTADVWYYISRIVDTRGNVTQKTFAVTFKDNKVVSYGYTDTTP